MNLNNLSWIEIGLSLLLLLIGTWIFTGTCQGRPLGLDCESWLIFWVNLLLPLGILLLGCGVWSWKTGSRLPQYILLGGVILILGYWIYHMV